MLFFSSEIPDGTWKLNDEESRHIKVLRLHEGEKLTFTNGKGERIEAALDKVDKHCTLTTLSRETIENENRVFIHYEYTQHVSSTAVKTIHNKRPGLT